MKIARSTTISTTFFLAPGHLLPWILGATGAFGQLFLGSTGCITFYYIMPVSITCQVVLEVARVGGPPRDGAKKAPTGAGAF